MKVADSLCRDTNIAGADLGHTSYVFVDFVFDNRNGRPDCVEQLSPTFGFHEIDGNCSRFAALRIYR